MMILRPYFRKVRVKRKVCDRNNRGSLESEMQAQLEMQGLVQSLCKNDNLNFLLYHIAVCQLHHPLLKAETYQRDFCISDINQRCRHYIRRRDNEKSHTEP